MSWRRRSDWQPKTHVVGYEIGKHETLRPQFVSRPENDGGTTRPKSAESPDNASRWVVCPKRE